MNWECEVLNFIILPLNYTFYNIIVYNIYFIKIKLIKKNICFYTFNEDLLKVDNSIKLFSNKLIKGTIIK